MSHYCIYRIFDAEDRLLYIGMTENIDERMYRHLQKSTRSAASLVIQDRWSYWTTEPFPHRRAMQDAESEAIKEEAPLLNRVHNIKRFKRNLEMAFIPA
jgi:predicted GIY-YIG superfamily endonuclease